MPPAALPVSSLFRDLSAWSREHLAAPSARRARRAAAAALATLADKPANPTALRALLDALGRAAAPDMVVDAAGNTALHRLLRQGAMPSPAIRALLKAGACPDLPNAAGETARSLARARVTHAHRFQGPRPGAEGYPQARAAWGEVLAEISRIHPPPPRP